MRKAFSFYRSFYDVYKELSQKDKALFMDALLNRQFEGIEPEGLTGMAKFAYISQKEVIDQQIQGWETKTGEKLTATPWQGGAATPKQGGSTTPSEQEEGQEKEKEEEKGKEQGGVDHPWPTENFIAVWDTWKKYKKEQFNFRYKSKSTEQAALTSLNELAADEVHAIKIIHQSIANGWKGFFKLKTNGQQKFTKFAGEQLANDPDYKRL